MENNLLDQVVKDKKIRRAIARQSHRAFSLIYLPNHFKEDPAPFHQTLYEITEGDDLFNVVVAFRGSAKTTIMALSYPIWAIIGDPKKKFVLIISQTQAQARQILANIKYELEENTLLRKDLGPFEEPDDEWKAQSIVLPKYGARITAVSVESSVRGIKHRENRPDLIIVDDVEDYQSTRSLDQRDKTYKWVLSDALTAGNPGKTKVIVIGNLLHEDSLIMRFRREIEVGDRSGTFHSFPLVDKNNESLWPARYPDQKAIEVLKKQVGNIAVFELEYMLHIVATHDQVIHKEWLHWYSQLPESVYAKSYLIGMDPATSESEKSDCTAIISAKVFKDGDVKKLYILPNPINEHLSSPDSLKVAEQLGKNALPMRAVFYVEDVGYQKSLIQFLELDGYQAHGVSVRGMDKRQRLAITAHLIMSGEIVFPELGAEILIQQLVGFGSERYDDLADAFSVLVSGYLQMQQSNNTGKVISVRCTSLYKSPLQRLC